MFNFDEFLTDYLTKGFYRFNASDVLSEFPTYLFEPIKTIDRTFKTGDPKERLSFYSDLQKHVLTSLCMGIQVRYFNDLRMDMHFSDMWSRVGENVLGWHSDFAGNPPGFNSSLNCYFDDSSEETGGLLQFHPASDIIPEDSPFIHSVYPKKYDIVVLNQHPNFMHRVSPCNTERRMMSFVCAFLDFNHPD